MVPVWTLSVLLVVMAFKHYAADFLLQTNWIARGKERRAGWVLPLMVHVLIHAAFTLLIVLLLAPRLWWLAPVEFVVHGAIDRGKSLIAQRGRWSATDAPFWWLIGFDQFLHQVTNVALVVALLTL
jgi:hypothetical protein